ncbi:hypothetical protein [Hazenella coriacea]|uniref:Uncharacterized protein n=1 Tax=Hazenella coriacea TaxID=1179467 RepID=A0A4R3L609_9BACL|nr:hypothetical protein [Hazenella coriacea]TCS92819.1 hypothetical protein EDD58_11046 [Hazenella coriacea]
MFNETPKTVIQDTEAKMLHSMVPRVKLSDGLVIGGVTGIGYFAAYLSETGYKSYFGLPSLYADVSLNAIILSISSIVIVLWMLYLAINHSTFSRYGKFTVPVILPLGIAIFLGIKIDFEINIPIWLLVITLLLFVFITAGMIAFAVRKSWFYAGLLFIIFVIGISRTSGYIVAANQTEYLVTLEPQPYVVVDTYKDALILMPIDLKTKKLSTEYRFVDQKSEMDATIQLQKMKLGSLQVISVDDK